MASRIPGFACPFDLLFVHQVFWKHINLRPSCEFVSRKQYKYKFAP